jgi:cyclomaltodextrinase
MLNLLGSHDMARFLTLARGDTRVLELATLFQMIYPGAPSIYYGDEIGMTGGHDPANRGAFPWHNHELWDRDLLHYFQRLIALRRERPALRRGTFQFLWAADGVSAVARQLDGETVIALFNTSQETRRLDLPVASLLADDTVLTECWGREVAPVETGTLRRLELAPSSSRVYATPH